MRKVLGFVIVATVILLVVSACAPAAPTPAPTSKPAAPATGAPATPKPAAAAPTVAPPTPKPAPLTVKMSGIAGSLSDSGLLVAQEKGYFLEQGLNLEYIQVAAAADVIAQTSTGQLDASGGGWSLALANATLRGVPLKVVADKMSKQPGFTYYRISFRKDLFETGQLKEMAQLKGRKVGVTSAASMGVLLAPNLKEVNLTLKDLDLVPLPFPEMVTALANKSLDAAVLAEPLLAKAVGDGLVVKGKDLFDVDPAPSAGVIYFSPQFAQNVDGANRFVAAYIKGLRDYTDAFRKNKGKPEIVAILAKRTGIDATLFDKVEVPGFDPDGYADKRALEWGTNYWLSTGELAQAIDLNKMVDNSYVEAALQKMGKYAR